MPVINEHFTINTQGNNDIINITKHVQNCVYQHELKDALVCVSIQGSTSAVTTIEYETGLIQDLKEALERIAPTGAEYIMMKSGTMVTVTLMSVLQLLGALLI